MQLDLYTTLLFKKIETPIFISFVTKSVHYEVASDITKRSFIAVPKRFTIRCVKCTIYILIIPLFFWISKSTLGYLKQIIIEYHQQNFHQYLIKGSIIWKFIPAGYSYFSGSCKAAVKSYKYPKLQIVG